MQTIVLVFTHNEGLGQRIEPTLTDFIECDAQTDSNRHCETTFIMMEMGDL